MSRSLPWPALLAGLFLTGCLASPPPPVSPNGDGARDESAGVQADDLGIVLTRGQTIRHEFVLRNPTAKPVRVLGAQALMPCCSRIVTVPATIPARGEARLAVDFQPEFQSGRKQVGFRVGTDREDEPVLGFVLRAALVPEVQVRTVEGGGLSLLMGKSGKQVLRVVARRYKEEGLSARETIADAGTVKATFVGGPTEMVRPDGVVESWRDVAVEILPDREAGSRTEALVFGWADGRAWDHRLHWTVTPHLRAIPDGLIVGLDDAVKAVAIRSETAPFRILGIEGGGVASVGEGSNADRPSRSHLIRLDFHGDRPRPTGPFDVTIRTDHPEQPEVTVSVLMSHPDGR